MTQHVWCMKTPEGRAARQRPSWFTAKLAESPSVSCNSAQMHGHPDWVTTSAVKPTFWDSDSFNFKCHGLQLPPNRCNLAGTLSCNPAQSTKQNNKETAGQLRHFDRVHVHASFGGSQQVIVHGSNLQMWYNANGTFELKWILNVKVFLSLLVPLDKKTHFVQANFFKRLGFETSAEAVISFPLPSPPPTLLTLPIFEWWVKHLVFQVRRNIGPVTHLCASYHLLKHSISVWNWSNMSLSPLSLQTFCNKVWVYFL